MIIDRRNTKFGEQIVLVADEDKILINGDTKAKTVYIGNGSSILDWKEIVNQDETDLDNNIIQEDMSQEKIKQYLISGVQNYMDKIAQERGYDGILSACTYTDTDVERFDLEGIKAKKWRSKVWEYCYAYLDDVLNGKRTIPTLEELINELPKLEW